MPSPRLPLRISSFVAWPGKTGHVVASSKPADAGDAVLRNGDISGEVSDESAMSTFRTDGGHFDDSVDTAVPETRANNKNDDTICNGE